MNLQNFCDILTHLQFSYKLTIDPSQKDKVEIYIITIFDVKKNLACEVFFVKDKFFKWKPVQCTG